jgi:hypothetical protein
MNKQALYLAPAIEVSVLVEEETLLTESSSIIEITGDAGIESGLGEDVQGLNGEARTLLNNLLFN